MHEEATQQNKDAVAIALIQKDIGYIKESMTKIETTLAVFDRNFARKEEMSKLEKALDESERNITRTIESMDREMKKGIVDIERQLKEELGKKVDNKEFDPIKKTLSRINWLMIAGVITALLSLIIQSGK